MKQPNSWSCMPCSFAMALGISYKEIIALIGHDGSKIVRPECKGADSRVGFHQQEMVDVCFKLDKNVTEIIALPCYKIADNTVHDWKYTYEQSIRRFRKYLKKYNGVMWGTLSDGRNHAVCWKDGKIHDPNGTIYDFGDNMGIQIIGFYLIK